MSQNENTTDKPQGSCPCGFGKDYAACCGRLHSGLAKAQSALELMRSRYSAYALNNIAYLAATQENQGSRVLDTRETELWNRDVVWKGLEIISVSEGGPDDKQGKVEFRASFEKAGQPGEIHELSSFIHKSGAWRYVTGRKPGPAPLKSEAKPGRNDPCPCGSGRKYKRCCAG